MNSTFADVPSYNSLGAIEILGNIGDARAVEPLISAMREISGKMLMSSWGFNPAPNTLHVAIITALGRIGPPAVEPLIRELAARKMGCTLVDPFIKPRVHKVAIQGLHYAKTGVSQQE